MTRSNELIWLEFMQKISFYEVNYLNACIFLSRKNLNVLQFCMQTSVDVRRKFFQFQEIFAILIEMQQILTK